MIKKLRLRSSRTISFDVQNFCVPTTKRKGITPFRRRISASHNIGFKATQNKLSISNNKLEDINLQLSYKKIEFGLRQFIIDNNQIKFSTPFDKENFDGEGAGIFKPEDRLGKLLGLELMPKQLLIIQEYGLSTLDISFDPSQFNLQLLVKPMDAITPNTARVVGDTIYFLTSVGVCRLRRGVLELLDIDVNAHTGTHNATYKFMSTTHGGKYFLSLGNKILVIDKLLNSVSFIDPITNIAQWTSDTFTVHYAITRQSLRQIHLRTSGDITLTAITESRKQRFNIKGKKGIQRINLNLKGESFRIQIETNTSGDNDKSDRLEIGDLTATVALWGSGVRD